MLLLLLLLCLTLLLLLVLLRVEQQLMSRMIADMYRPAPPDPAQNDSTDQSELEEQSFTSDIGNTKSVCDNVITSTFRMQ